MTKKPKLTAAQKKDKKRVMDAIEQPLAEAIEPFLSEVEKWGPGALSDHPAVGHGVPQRGLTERAEQLAQICAERVADRTVAPPPTSDTPKKAKKGSRKRAAHREINHLFAAYFGRNRDIEDARATQTIEELVNSIETWRQAQDIEVGIAKNAELMTRLPKIYEAFLRKHITFQQQGEMIKELLEELELVPEYNRPWQRMLKILVREESEIRKDIYENGTRIKRSGPVETAAYAVQHALEVLGVSWKHGRTELLASRKMTLRARMLATAPGAYGTRTNPAATVTCAERSIMGRGRKVTSLK